MATATTVQVRHTPIVLSRVNRFTRKGNSNNQDAQPPTESEAGADITVEAGSPDLRAEFIRQLFQKCDVDQVGRLTLREMRKFALLTDFEGTDADWAEEYNALCGERGADPVEGLSLDEFQAFLDDDSDTGQYCDEQELRDMLANFDTKLMASEALLEKQMPEQSEEVLEAHASSDALHEQQLAEPEPEDLSEQAGKTKREQLVQRVFELCDVGGDGRLTERELRTFAQLTGFDGSESEWAEEYCQLCADSGISAAKGLGFEDFARLLEDESDAGQYCTDAELEEFLENVKTTSFTNTWSASHSNHQHAQKPPRVGDVDVPPPCEPSPAVIQKDRTNEKSTRAQSPAQQRNTSREEVSSGLKEMPVNSGPPPWLPMKKASGASSAPAEVKSTFHNRQTALLKAALGQRPVADVVGPSMRDLHGGNRGPMDGPEKGRGKGGTG